MLRLLGRGFPVVKVTLHLARMYGAAHTFAQEGGPPTRGGVDSTQEKGGSHLQLAKWHYFISEVGLLRVFNDGHVRRISSDLQRTITLSRHLFCWLMKVRANQELCKISAIRRPIACTEPTAYRSGCKCRRVWAQIQLESKAQSRTAALAGHIRGRIRLPWSRRSGRFHRCRWVPHTRNRRWTVASYGR